MKHTGWRFVHNGNKKAKPVIQPLNIVLIGVGLIGGSFVLDLKRQNVCSHVHGIDLDAENLKRAIERKVIDSSSTEIDAAVTQADLIVIATPVGTIKGICQRLIPFLKANTIIMDVGSTKQVTLESFQAALPHHLPYCVAAHPIAGSDRSGATAAQFSLFANKKLILCANPVQNDQAYQTIKQLWQSVGASIHELSAQEHDEIFATVSHLPHLLAYAYINQVASASNSKACLDFAATGFQDFTRIAASHPAIWTDVSLANQTTLLKLLQEQQEQLQHLIHLLKTQDKQGLYDYYQQAQVIRENWHKQQ